MLTIAGIGDAADFRIGTWLNGEFRQDDRAADLIYSIGEMIEELSSVFTLEPGDILRRVARLDRGRPWIRPAL